jgi:hypothetical protein
MERSKMTELVGRREKIRQRLRNPMVAKDLFGVENDPNFKYRYVEIEDNERLANVERCEDLGWEVVQSTQTPGNKTMKYPSRLGKGAVVKSFGGKSVQVLMRIPKEMWIENQKIKDEINKENLEKSRGIKIKGDGTNNLDIKDIGLSSDAFKT